MGCALDRTPAKLSVVTLEPHRCLLQVAVYCALRCEHMYQRACHPTRPAQAQLQPPTTHPYLDMGARRGYMLVKPVLPRCRQPGLPLLTGACREGLSRMEGT